MLQSALCLLQKDIYGQLELYGDRVEFSPKDSKHPSIHIGMNDIKAQFVNPRSSARALLRIQLQSQDKPIQFQFMGDKPHDERDSFKDTLASCLNAFRTGQPAPTEPTSSKEDLAAEQRQPLSMEQIKARQTLLQRDQKLAKLHRDLVRGGLLMEEDFWLPRLHILDGQLAETTQIVGLTSEISHDIRPSSSEGSEIKYTLTPQDIQSIFLHHPALKRAYDTNVPAIVSETEFWTRCFQSNFFYRDRAVGGSKVKKDSIFDKAVEEDERELEQSATGNGKVHNFLLDLAESERMDEFQPQLDSTMKFAKASQSLPLIRRFNRHGSLIVQSIHNSSSQASEKQPRHKQILRDVLKLDDLEPKPEVKPIMLHIEPGAGYQSMPETRSDNEIPHLVDIGVICKRIKTSYESKPSNPEISTIDSQASVNILKQLAGSHTTLDIEKVNVGDDIFNFHANVVEVLKNFWINVPPANNSHETHRKIKRIVKALETLSQQFDTIISRSSQSDNSHLKSIRRPLIRALEEAAKYQHQEAS